jgi:histone-lysine N-methyltransferase SETD3
VALDDPGPRGEAYRTFAALGEDALAALWLVFERALGERSPWAPLVRSLPPRRTEAETDARDSASFPGTPAPISTPLSWSPAATQILLGGTPLLADAEALQARFANQ